LAFLVPIVQRILAQDPSLANKNRVKRARSDDIRAIIISPTRELAEQIAVEAQKLVRNTSIKVQTAVGGTMKSMMLRETQRDGCHVLVATPGRLADLLEDSTSRIDAPGLQALVLDEADRMLEQGFQNELDNIVAMLPDPKDVPRQTLLFSATIPRNVIGLARTYINENNFEFVQTINPDDVPTHESVPQHIVPCVSFANLHATLLELIRREAKNASSIPGSQPFKAIVFMPTTTTVVMMASVFQRLGFHDKSLPPVFDIHSKLTQAQRTNSANRFRKATSAILFSSDVTARGMDFPNVTHVIQMHLPTTRDQYIHRLGRTGRAGKEGQGWLIVGSMELELARKRLGGLPIKRNTELTCATVDVAQNQDLPQQFADMKRAISVLPAHITSDAYRSYFGGGFQGLDIQEVVDQANEMALHGWGLPEQPAVSEKMARTTQVRGLRIEESHQGRNPLTRYIGRGRGGFDRTGGRGGDAFDRMGDRGYDRSDRMGGRGGNRMGSRSGSRMGNRGDFGNSRGFDRNSEDFSGRSNGMF